MNFLFTLILLWNRLFQMGLFIDFASHVGGAFHKKDIFYLVDHD